jgi:hypothetical protein
VIIAVVAAIVLIGGAGAAYGLTHGGGTSSTANGTPTNGTPTVAPIYASSLTGNLSGWPTGDGCSPEADGFHVTADISCFAPTNNLTDFEMKVTEKTLNSDTTKLYGVTFRSSEGAGQAIGNTYVFLISGDGNWVLAKIVGGNATSLAQSASPNVAISASGTNLIDVSMRGTHIVAMVNGTQIAAVDDGDVASGQCGLQGSDGGEAVFTNLTITK